MNTRYTLKVVGGYGNVCMSYLSTYASIELALAALAKVREEWWLKHQVGIADKDVKIFEEYKDWALVGSHQYNSTPDYLPGSQIAIYWNKMKELKERALI